MRIIILCLSVFFLLGVTGVNAAPSYDETHNVEINTYEGKVEIKIGYLLVNERSNFHFRATDMPLSSLGIIVNKEVSDVEITLSTLDEKPSDISKDINGTVKEYIQIETKNIQDGDIDYAYVMFKVPPRWMDDNNINKTSIVINRYSNGEWNPLNTILDRESVEYAYYSAESPGLGIFGISGENTSKTTQPLATTEPEEPKTTAPPTTPPATSTSTPTVPPLTSAPPTPGPSMPYAKIGIVLVIALGIFISLFYFIKKRKASEIEGLTDAMEPEVPEGEDESAPDAGAEYTLSRLKAFKEKAEEKAAPEEEKPEEEAPAEEPAPKEEPAPVEEEPEEPKPTEEAKPEEPAPAEEVKPEEEPAEEPAPTEEPEEEPAPEEEKPEEPAPEEKEPEGEPEAPEEEDKPEDESKSDANDISSRIEALRKKTKEDKSKGDDPLKKFR
jgi:PGF-pre-PGF domain-containing protein